MGKKQPLTDALFKLIKGKEAKDENPDFLIWKQQDGTYRWLSIFSNNYRDNDNPPEILSAESHEEFVKEVDNGLAPYPELMLWHVPGSRIGETELLTFDGNFIIATGPIDKGKENIAERMSQIKGLAASHGMPQMYIQRDENDPSVITRYRSSEISVLPLSAAANKRTSFIIQDFSEVKDMTIPKEKSDFLQGLGIDVSNLEGQLESKRQAAEEEGVESKSIEPNEEVAEQVAEVIEEVVAEVEVQQEEVIEEPVVEEQVVVEEIKGSEVRQLAEALAEAFKTISKRLDIIETSVKTLKQSHDVGDNLTPFAAMFNTATKSRVVGKVASEVKESDEFTGPEEKDPVDVPYKTGINAVDHMLAGGDWRDAYKPS